MKSGDITLVIPVYNRAEVVSRTLQSLHNQQLKPAKVILVDNNSSDNSLAVINRWAEEHNSQGWDVTILEQPLPGAANARNLGLEHVTTAWTMFFDSDDVMAPNHIQDFQRAIDSNPDADLIGRNLRIQLASGKYKTGFFCAKNPLFHNLLRGILSTQRYIARTDLFRRAGGWNRNIHAWDDWELGTRLLLQNPKIIKISGTPTITTYFQEESLTGNRFCDKKGVWEQAINTTRQNLINAHRQDALKWLDLVSMILAAAYAREGDKKAAMELRNEVLKNCRAPRRLKLLYHHNRIIHRLTWVAGKMIL